VRGCAFVRNVRLLLGIDDVSADVRQ